MKLLNLFFENWRFSKSLFTTELILVYSKVLLYKVGTTEMSILSIYKVNLPSCVST